MKKFFLHAKEWLGGLSFRTGVIVLVICAICYVISFAQAALPISLAAKGTLWVIFFGLAKAFQYAGLLILGKEGWKKLRRIMRNGRKGDAEPRGAE